MQLCPTPPANVAAGRVRQRVLFLCTGNSARSQIADPAAEAGTDAATYPAFQRVADEIEERVSLLLADLAHRPTERTTHHA